METAIRWAPASTPDDQRFLYVDIKGQEFKHCKVTSRPDKFTLTYDVLSAFSHGSEFRSFDWCPTEENLVAVGHASGDVVVAHLDTGALIPLALPSKVQRACHGLAWNSSGLLAAGLDKFRGDYCLNIWDPHQRPVRMASRGGSERQVPDPLRRYANGEPVASVRFFNDQPSLLIAGMKGHSVRLYDLRESHGNPSLQFSTRCVHELTVNRLDENYFASCAPFDNASICIWDRRSGSRYSTAAGTSSGTIDAGHVLEIRPGIASGSTIRSLRFSQTQRGRLGMLTDRGIFRAYHIAKDHSPDELRAALEKTVGRGSSKHYPEQLYTKTVRDFQTSFPPKTRSEDSSQRVSAFDFMTTDSFDGLEAITILNDRNVAVYSLPLGSSLQPKDRRQRRPPKKSKITHLEKWSVVWKEGKPMARQEKTMGRTQCGTGIISSRQRREKLLLPEKLANVQDALTLMTIPRLRLREGYTLNPERNQNIVSDDTALQDLWAWIERAHTRASDGSMIIHGVDMNYLGVQSIWSGNLGLSLENRLASSDLDDDVDVPKLIEQLAKKLDLQETKMCDTDFMPQRQLCLYICGAIASVDDLEGVVTQLVEERQHTQAAAFALFHDETELAYKALRNNRPTQAHKLLAMAIAGAPRGDPNFDWEEACAEIAKELTDPFAKAILALVSKGSWESVLRETTLPLRYRVEVAVRWLPDDQLTTYIRDTSMEAVQQGDIEGAVLTGLDHAAMDLFQSYINKFNDIQTAVLVMNYAVPRLVSDAFNANRFHAWRETYRQQMNSWKMHLHRAKFDVDSRNLAVSWDGRKLTRSQPQQVSLVCNYCTRPLSQQEERPDHQLAGAESTHHTPNNPLGSAQMGGTVCPKCGRHMPRCGVCSLWLGSPHPLSRAAIADDSKKGEEAHRPEEMLKRFVVFCIKCNHGYHADHAKVWFSRHKSCPVSECGCICEG
ncbi:CDNA sequence [Coccidioides immitis H538.4]|uniref:cDNA sequence n=1 Tax=Coccidioides immitis H538.4 TaxID=396776 RepID=A0A0J8RXL9_COCIT|nr:CDNA sequence [Coccidioides immitis H538.4]